MTAISAPHACACHGAMAHLQGRPWNRNCLFSTNKAKAAESSCGSISSYNTASLLNRGPETSLSSRALEASYAARAAKHWL